MEALVPLAAVLLDRMAGYPQALVRTIGHPVIWGGALLGTLEARLNRPDWSRASRRWAGVVALMILLLSALALCPGLIWIARLTPLGFLLESVLAASLLAQKHLGCAVRDVAFGLRQSLPHGRRAVSQIVGRDPEALDRAGVARAAVESLAENASDGVIAPLFWLVLLGLPGIALYKMINTADSMVGHLDDRYRDFGWASARLDDLVNLVPARLTALLLVLAAASLPEADARAAAQAARRDAGKHRSPNAGWPEAAMAGALGVSLGGPRAYGGEILDLPQMGDGRSDLGPEDIERALALYRRLLDIALLATTAVVLIQIVS